MTASGTAEECLWTPVCYWPRFNGWQRPVGNDGSKPYLYWLAEYAKFYH
jgi:hypothetical protein